MQVSKLTNQHPVAAVMSCQSSVCVMYSMCNILDNQLVFLKIEANLYLQFNWSVQEIQYDFWNKIDHIYECQHKKSVQGIEPSSSSLLLSYLDNTSWKKKYLYFLNTLECWDMVHQTIIYCTGIAWISCYGQEIFICSIINTCRL